METSRSSTDQPQKRARTSQTQREIICKSRKHSDDTGDLELLTSDGVLFKIHAFHLQTAAQIFRDMINSTTNSRISLNDATIETAVVLGSLLNIIKGVRIKTEDVYEITVLTPVIRLAQKYACDDIIERISLQCRVDTYEKRCRPLIPLMVGFATNDMELCTNALKIPGGQWKPEEWPACFGDLVDEGLVMDPTALPLEISGLVKPETMWTWMRAYRNRYHSGWDEKGAVHCIAEETEWLYEAYGSEFRSLAELEHGGPPFALAW